MHAISIPDYGGPEALELKSVARPEPKAGEVLVRIMAAGVNPIDWKLRAGYLKAFMPLTFPWTPGIDAAGIVESVGAGVSAFKPGQAVFGLFTGAYAEYALAPAGDLILKPERLSFEEAATIPVPALTAWKALIEDGRVSAGQRVLILGAAGGVGIFAVQLARWKGADVIVTGSQDNADFLRSLGAETVIDYRSRAFEQELRDIDLVLDTVGGETLDRAYTVVMRGGLLLTIAGQVSQEKAQAQGIRAQVTGRGPADRLKQLVELIELGKLKLRVGVTFPLAEARKAHELGQTGHGKGRIVLRV
jgi:NADPH:quinone reductase-like Zn-dependent oxidoreductase